MESQLNQDARQSQRRGGPALLILAGIAIAGLALVAIFAGKTASPLSVFSVASMFAVASVLAGGLFGFLFGIPRTLQHQKDAEPSSGKGNEGKASTYAPNTNLEQISDWLTKILVGAGLIQVTKLQLWLGETARSLAPGFGGGDSGRVFALATVLSYALLGFLLGYLWTRLYFAGALHAADVETLTREIKEIREQSDLDAKALALALRELNPSADMKVPTQQELDDAIKDASQGVKAQIFYQARSIRSETWSEPSKKAKMERTIPIFQALIHSDKDEEYHMNYGQLGFAIKDSRTPDWKAAETALTKAIQIRGSWEENDWVLYEFNRAVCRIMQDADYAQGRPSSADARKRIVEDLRVFFAFEGAPNIVATQREVSSWIELNKVTKKELETDS
jgi:hypothetical protein